MMLSFRSWFLLLLVYVIYLIIGGYSFHALENLPDCENVDRFNNERDRLRILVANFRDNLYGSNREEFDVVLKTFSNVFSDVPDFTQDDFVMTRNDSSLEDPCFQWNLYNSIFFSFTAITTIGFGHLSPATDNGKILCIFYSLLGVPINGILVASIGAYFNKKLKTLASIAEKAESQVQKVMYICIDVFIFLIPGSIVFLFIPAVAFTYIEDWTYLDSVYFAFITLTTIGFGDFVAGRDLAVLSKLGDWRIVYEIGLLVWITFGLGYIFMLIAFIADSLRKPGRKAALGIKAAEKMMMGRIIQELIAMKSGKGEEKRKAKSVCDPMEETQVIDDFDRDETDKVETRSEPSTLHRDKGEELRGTLENLANIVDEVMSTKGSVADDKQAKEDSNSDSSATHDTITSLSAFMSSNKNVDKHLLVENNLPDSWNILNKFIHEQEANARHRKERRAISTLHPPEFMTRKIDETSNSNALSPESSLTEDRFRRQSVGPLAPTSRSGWSINDHKPTLNQRLHSRPSKLHSSESEALHTLLANTTFEDFLKAAETVQKKEDHEDHSAARRKTSSMSLIGNRIHDQMHKLFSDPIRRKESVKSSAKDSTHVDEVTDPGCPPGSRQPSFTIASYSEEEETKKTSTRL